jgi:hypothetical protein
MFYGDAKLIYEIEFRLAPIGCMHRILNFSNAGKVAEWRSGSVLGP